MQSTPNPAPNSPTTPHVPNLMQSVPNLTPSTPNLMQSTPASPPMSPVLSRQNSLLSSQPIAKSSSAQAIPGSEWREAVTKDGRKYFYNVVTRQTSWTMPGWLYSGLFSHLVEAMAKQAEPKQEPKVEAPQQPQVSSLIIRDNGDYRFKKCLKNKKSHRRKNKKFLKILRMQR